jgi:HSP20 family protein
MANKDLATPTPSRPASIWDMPFPAMGSFRPDFDSLFDRFFRGSALPVTAESNSWTNAVTPRLDVAETDAAYQVSAELPGVEPADVTVTVTDGRLVIKGEKKAEKEDKGKDWHRIERSYGSFQRAIDLPLTIAEDKVLAEFSKGVLKVTLPKAPSAQAATKKIAIKATS